MNIKSFPLSVLLLFLIFSAVDPVKAQGPAGEEYIVQADDWLSKIAEKLYGDPLTYPVIVAATNARAAEDDSFVLIENPDIIEVGQKLWLPAAGQDFTVDTLRNIAYHGIYVFPVQLTDGKYDGPGGIITFVDELVVFGDLNSDGVEDAAVLLFEISSGTEKPSYVAAVVNQGGSPTNVGIAGVGDHIQVKSMTIEEQQIAITFVTRPLFDSPSEIIRSIYALQDDELVPVSRGSLGAISGTDLDGTTWRLSKLLAPGQQIIPDADITLTIETGQISGFAGCNTYTAPLEVGKFQHISIGPITATKKTCPHPILNQEIEYLSKLAEIREWSYLAGQLALAEFLGVNELIFTAQSPGN